MKWRTTPALVLAVLMAVPAWGLEVTPLLQPSLEGFEPAVAGLIGERQRLLAALLASDDLSGDRAAAELGDLGRLYLAYNLSEAAESCLVNAARLAPDDPVWHYLRGMIRQQGADLEEARELFGRVVELAPSDAAAQTRLAQVEFELGNLDQAESLFAAVVDLTGFDAVAHYGLGRIAASRGDLDAAIEHYLIAIEAQPGAGPPRYQLATAYRRNGEREKAREQLALRAKGDVGFPDPVVASLGKGVEGVEIYLSAGRKARQAKDYEAALGAFGRAAQAEPDNPEHLRTIGAVLAEMGSFEQSVGSYRLVLERAPDDPGALYNIATGLLELGQVAEARRHLGRLVEKYPEHADGRVNLATIHEQAGEFALAELVLNEAIALEPYDSSLRVRRASVLTSAGRHSEARGELRKILAQEPNNAEALVVLGAANEALGSKTEAVGAWRRVLEDDAEADPETAARARLLLGRALLREGRAEEAVEYLSAAVDVLAQQPDARLVLAGALGAKGDFDGAAEQYRLALEIEPRNESARFGRALSLLLAGREQEARLHLEGSLSSAGDSVALKHLLARVLATAEDAAVRDGASALRLAQQVFEQVQSLDHAETLAMAYAEAGDFQAALDWQARIIERARAMGESGRLRGLEARRAQYERREAARAPWLQR